MRSDGMSCRALYTCQGQDFHDRSAHGTRYVLIRVVQSLSTAYVRSGPRSVHHGYVERRRYIDTMSEGTHEGTPEGTVRGCSGPRLLPSVGATGPSRRGALTNGMFVITELFADTEYRRKREECDDQLRTAKNDRRRRCRHYQIHTTPAPCWKENHREQSCYAQRIGGSRHTQRHCRTVAAGYPGGCGSASRLPATGRARAYYGHRTYDLGVRAAARAMTRCGTASPRGPPRPQTKAPCRTKDDRSIHTITTRNQRSVISHTIYRARAADK